MRKLIILTLIFGINSCTAPSESEKKLIGKWIMVEEMDTFFDDIEPLTGNDSESESDSKTNFKLTLTFNKDKTVSINQMGDKFYSNYTLTDSILTLGNRNYIIMEISKNKLIYKNKAGLFDKHYEYKRVE